MSNMVLNAKTAQNNTLDSGTIAKLLIQFFSNDEEKDDKYEKYDDDTVRDLYLERIPKNDEYLDFLIRKNVLAILTTSNKMFSEDGKTCYKKHIIRKNEKDIDFYPELIVRFKKQGYEVYEDDEKIVISWEKYVETSENSADSEFSIEPKDEHIKRNSVREKIRSQIISEIYNLEENGEDIDFGDIPKQYRFIYAELFLALLIEYGDEKKLEIFKKQRINYLAENGPKISYDEFEK